VGGGTRLPAVTLEPVDLIPISVAGSSGWLSGSSTVSAFWAFSLAANPDPGRQEPPRNRARPWGRAGLLVTLAPIGRPCPHPYPTRPGANVPPGWAEVAPDPTGAAPGHDHRRERHRPAHPGSARRDQAPLLQDRNLTVATPSSAWCGPGCARDRGRRGELSGVRLAEPGGDDHGAPAYA
jgi:hypothetical protein